MRASDGTLNEDRMVKVTVSNVDEPPEITVGGLAISGGPASVNYAEDRTDAVGTYTASGPEAASARWSLDGDDAGDFRIGSSSGVLTFVRAPDYDTKTTYRVTVNARDSEGSTATRSVTGEGDRSGGGCARHR